MKPDNPTNHVQGIHLKALAVIGYVQFSDDKPDKRLREPGNSGVASNVVGLVVDLFVSSGDPTKVLPHP
jgi:hypothetical protein